MFKTPLLIFSVCILLYGCATQDGQANSSKKLVQNDPDVVCKVEKPTGSRIAQKRCWSREDYEAQAKQAEKDMQRMGHNRGVSSGGEN